MRLKIIIIDDEFPAIQLLKEYSSRISEIDVVTTFSKASAALEYLGDNTTDLLLLDIQMPVLNGIELLTKLATKPMCIFITANPEHAVKAYELDVIDYLVKPVSFERFKKAVEKAIDFYRYKLNNLKVDEGKQFLMVKADYKITKIFIKDIKWIEGSGEYVKIVTESKKILVLDSLNNYIDNLLPDGFIRIHKSFIVPIKSISQFTSTSVLLNEEKEFTIGRAYKYDVMRILKLK